ncbi:MAG TPA: hypothetical protein VF541_19860 [Longimicrobium sp.]|jgi:hypothetical protein
MGGTWGGIVWSGFVAGVLAACVLWLFRTLGLTRLSATGQLGCLFYDDPRLPMTETLGFGLFLALHATLLAALYAAVLRGLGGPGWGTGVAVGGVHGFLAAAALPWLARASRCVRMGRLPPPGRFGMEWGAATPVALVAGYAAYGSVFGAVLKALSTRAP